MHNVLIIDDDRELCLLIKRSVLLEDIEADFCNTGKAGLQKLKEKQYQLVILDVMMPGMDGFETLEKIRKESSLPILMFTSKNDSASKVRGLRAGADDYLTKPFDMDELIARIVSLIRRYTRFNQQDGTAQQKLEFDGLQIDLENRSVTMENGSFELSMMTVILWRLSADFVKNWKSILQIQSISKRSKGLATVLIRRYSWYGNYRFLVHCDCCFGCANIHRSHSTHKKANSRNDRCSD